MVQDVNNSIPLVANKATAGRVSVITTGTSSPQPVLEYLYGQRGGNDLPGSPLVQQINAPLAVNRANLNDTANFLLPPSWTTLGEVTFHAEASDFNGHNIASDPATRFSFKARPCRSTGSSRKTMARANAPDLIAQSTIDAFESYVKTVFPVPDVTFVQKPWTVLGASQRRQPAIQCQCRREVLQRHQRRLLEAIMQNKQPPYALPDLIFGAANVGGGLSDPTWYNNSPGHAAAGGNATSGEGVAAHEFNHDLDRSSNGTWGRHVGACGASRPRPQLAEPDRSSHCRIRFRHPPALAEHQLQQDGRPIQLPGPDVVLPLRDPAHQVDLALPLQGLVHQPEPSRPRGPAALAGQFHLYQRTVNIGGSGALNPAFFAPGMPITPSASGAYSLQLSGPGIATITHAFDVVFQDVEGNPLTTSFFNFVLADPGGVTTIQLLHGAQSWRPSTKPPPPPSAAFTAPASGPLSGTADGELEPDRRDVPRRPACARSCNSPPMTAAPGCRWPSTCPARHLLSPWIPICCR